MSAPKTWAECEAEVDRKVAKAVADYSCKDPTVVAIFERAFLRSMATSQLYTLALEREQSAARPAAGAYDGTARTVTPTPGIPAKDDSGIVVSGRAEG